MTSTKKEQYHISIHFVQTKLKERLFEFTEKAQGIIERSNQKVALEPYTEKNLIDALELEKNLAAVIDDVRANKDNWIVSGIQRDSANQLVKV